MKGSRAFGCIMFWINIDIRPDCNAIVAPFWNQQSTDIRLNVDFRWSTLFNWLLYRVLGFGSIAEARQSRNLGSRLWNSAWHTNAQRTQVQSFYKTFPVENVVGRSDLRRANHSQISNNHRKESKSFGNNVMLIEYLKKNMKNGLGWALGTLEAVIHDPISRI